MKKTINNYMQSVNIAENDFLLTAEELAQLLRVSKGYIYKLAKTTDIPHYRIGRQILFSRKEIKDWLTLRCVI